MSVQALRRMTVAPTPCVPTRKDHMSVAVNGDMLEMAKTAQVKFFMLESSFAIYETFNSYMILLRFPMSPKVSFVV